jgi:hypothetical protein
MICFRIGAEDAPYGTREFAGYVAEIDLLQLPNHRVYLTAYDRRLSVKAIQRSHTRTEGL